MDVNLLDFTSTLWEVDNKFALLVVDYTEEIFYCFGLSFNNLNSFFVIIFISSKTYLFNLPAA